MHLRREPTNRRARRRMLRRGGMTLLLAAGMAMNMGDPAAAAAPESVADRAALLALDVTHLEAPALAFVAGYARAGDGGGGAFLWDANDTEAPDDVVVLAPHGDRPGRWVRQWWNGRLSPEMAGAVGDGTANDQPAFARLIAATRSRGPFTIALTPGRHYFIATMLDMSPGAPGTTLAGPAGPGQAGHDALPATRLELNPADGAMIKLGTGQVVRNVLVWRHGLEERPSSLEDVRTQVRGWAAEDGHGKARTIGIFVPFDDSRIEGCLIVGFHTGILAVGQRFLIRDTLIDAAGYAVEVTHSADTSLIDHVQTRGLWSLPAIGHDAYGDQSYRPGVGFFIHERADGLQINSVMSIGWVTGILLQGTPSANLWLVSLLQPNVETPPNDSHMTAAIRTEGAVRRITIIDPRIVSGGLGRGPSAALDFGPGDPNPAAAANDNVTVIGGALEVGSVEGNAVLIHERATGRLIGTTMTVIRGEDHGPLVKALAGAGRWAFVHPNVGGQPKSAWLAAEPGVSKQIDVVEPSATNH